MEAMATGLIAISTNCAGSSEVIMDGKTGYIVGKSVESLTEGMRKALNLSANEGQEIRQSAMDFIRGNFDIDHNVNKVFKTIGIN